MRNCFMLVSTCLFLVCSGSAQIVRQESTNVLKKAVYSVNLADCPQTMRQSRHYFEEGEEEVLYGADFYYAAVAIPELTLDNMPSVTVHVPSKETPFGWYVYQEDYPPILGDSVVYVLWKIHYYNGSNGDDCKIVHEQAKITVVYESQGQETLKVSNTGTGKSLALEWSTNAPNAKVEGYKVYRRSLME